MPFFIDDLRITEGLFRYPPEASFSVPTVAHPVDYANAPVPRASRVGATTAPSMSEYTVPESTFRTGDPSSYDTYDGGPVSIVGTVREYATPSNVPLRRRVRLYNELERRFVRETWSDEVTGNFAFTNMRQSKYTAIAYDHTGIYRALVVDQVEGVMP